MLNSTPHPLSSARIGGNPHVQLNAEVARGLSRQRSSSATIRSYTRVACLGASLVASYRLDNDLYLSHRSPIPSISVFAFCAVAVFFLSVERKGRIRVLLSEFVPLLVVIQLSAIGLFFGTQKLERIFQFLKTDAHTCVYLVFCALLVHLICRGSIRAVVRFYYFVLVGAAVLGILQFLTLAHLPTGLPEWALLSSNVDYGGYGSRSASFFLEPSWFAAALVDGIILGIAMGMSEGFRKYWLSLAILGIAFVLSSSLSGYFVMAVALAAFVWKAGRRGGTMRRRLITAVLWMAVAGMASFPLPSVRVAIFGRLSGLYTMENYQAANTRLAGMIAVGKVWLDHPLIGVGYGGTSFFAADYYRGFWALFLAHPTEYGATAAHATVDSVYMLLLSDTGLVGIAGLAICVFRLLRERRSKSVVRSMWNSALWALMAAALASLATTGALMQPRFWFIASLFLANRRMEEKQVKVFAKIGALLKSRRESE